VIAGIACNRNPLHMQDSPFHQIYGRGYSFVLKGTMCLPRIQNSLAGPINIFWNLIKRPWLVRIKQISTLFLSQIWGYTAGGSGIIWMYLWIG
jgi:hypothetical protein